MFASTVMMAQEAHISQAYAKPGDTVTLSVTGVHFTNIAALGMFLNWDKNSLTYMGVNNYYLPFYNEKWDTTRALVTNHNDTTYMLGWAEINEHNVAVEDSIKIFDIKFIYNGGNAIITFDTSNTIFEILKYKGKVKIPVNYFNGFVKNLDALGINEKMKEPFVVYPVPCRDILNIKPSQNTSIKNIRIYTTSGVEVTNVHLNSTDKISLSISSLPAGVYFLNIESNDTVSVKKLIKF